MVGSPTGTPQVPPRVDLTAGTAIRRRVVLAILVLATVVIGAMVLSLARRSAGPCSEEDLHLARRIPSFGGARLEFFDDPEGPGCTTVLEVEASATEVLDHYRGVLEDDGWDVSVQDTLVEGPEGATASELVAVRGESGITIALESFHGQVSAAIRVDA
jgi:hypothetical protein